MGMAYLIDSQRITMDVCLYYASWIKSWWWAWWWWLGIQTPVAQGWTSVPTVAKSQPFSFRKIFHGPERTKSRNKAIYLFIYLLIPKNHKCPSPPHPLSPPFFFPNLNHLTSHIQPNSHPPLSFHFHLIFHGNNFARLNIIHKPKTTILNLLRDIRRILQDCDIISDALF